MVDSWIELLCNDGPWLLYAVKDQPAGTKYMNLSVSAYVPLPQQEAKASASAKHCCRLDPYAHGLSVPTPKKLSCFLFASSASFLLFLFFNVHCFLLRFVERLTPRKKRKEKKKGFYWDQL